MREFGFNKTIGAASARGCRRCCEGLLERERTRVCRCFVTGCWFPRSTAMYFESGVYSLRCMVY